ncbi:MAG: hypothetical protein Q9157_005173 [Trypethelium eluteriae]
MTYYSSTLPFRAVLELGRDRVCSDPRDKVYGLLGLVSAPFAADIVPSYIQKVEDVYRETCLTYLSRFKRLDLLKSCYQTGRTLDLPSWSPDLQSDIPVDIFNPFQFATGCSRAHFTYTAPNILEVFGLTCAVLDKVSTPLSKTAVDPLNVIRSWQPEDAARSTYMTGESLSIAFAITLRMNRVKERFPKVRYTLDEWLARCFQTGLLGVDNEVAFANDDKEIQSFDGRAIDICTGRTFVRTREGYVGLAPCDAQQGDVIVVLLGCDSPVLLRKQPGQRYKVIGECFVHGLNDASALLGPLPKPWNVTINCGFGGHLLQWAGGRKTLRFFNSKTGAYTYEEPRLPPLGVWDRIDHTPGPNVPEIYEYFRHKKTGEVMDSDPRLLPEALKSRGVQLETFSLV